MDAASSRWWTSSSTMSPRSTSQASSALSIASATVTTSSDRLALSRFVFEMGDTTHLDRVLNAVRRIDGVYDVYRVNGG